MSVTELSGAGLSLAELSGAGLSLAELSGAGLTLAELPGAGVSLAELSGAGLLLAELSGAVLLVAGGVEDRGFDFAATDESCYKQNLNIVKKEFHVNFYFILILAQIIVLNNIEPITYSQNITCQITTELA